MGGGSSAVDAELLRDAPVGEGCLELPEASEGEEVVWDYAATGLTLRRHPPAILRPTLAAKGWKTAAKLHDLPGGRLATACGVESVRQQAGTAKGTMFVFLRGRLWKRANLRLAQGQGSAA